MSYYEKVQFLVEGQNPIEFLGVARVSYSTAGHLQCPVVARDMFYSCSLPYLHTIAISTVRETTPIWP